MLAAAGLFLTTPYVGYLDNITVLFLCPDRRVRGRGQDVVGRSRGDLPDRGGGRVHPPDHVRALRRLLLGVWVTHLVTSRFRLGSALRSDGPLLLSTGFGMLFGLALWVVGVWGPGGRAPAGRGAPPPYTAEFFRARLGEWVSSMQPLITFR